MFFENVFIQFNLGECYGIVGVNGLGKLMLFKIFVGEEGLSEGNVSVFKIVCFGVFKQDYFVYEEEVIFDVVMMGYEELWMVMQEKEKVFVNVDKEFDVDCYFEFEDIIMVNDGYVMEVCVGEIFEGFGIQIEVYCNLLLMFFGGFKLCVFFVQVFVVEFEVFIFDELMNYFDILSICWFEKFFVGYCGCLFVVLYDYCFFDNVSMWIVDVDYEMILFYKGNYLVFEWQKQEECDCCEYEINKQEKKKVEQQVFIDCFKVKVFKVCQVQSKVKFIECMEVIELLKSLWCWLCFNFQQVCFIGKLVVEVEGINKSYGEGEVKNQVLYDVKFEI